MDKIAQGFEDKDVVFYTVYTREPHAGEDRGRYDFSDKKQTRTEAERVAYAAEMIKERGVKRPILIDTFGPKCAQNVLGGARPNSLIVIDLQGKVALWQSWSDPKKLRAKLDEMTRNHIPSKSASSQPAGESDASPSKTSE